MRFFQGKQSRERVNDGKGTTHTQNTLLKCLSLFPSIPLIRPAGTAANWKVSKERSSRAVGIVLPPLQPNLPSLQQATIRERHIQNVKKGGGGKENGGGLPSLLEDGQKTRVDDVVVVVTTAVVVLFREVTLEAQFFYMLLSFTV